MSFVIIKKGFQRKQEQKVLEATVKILIQF